MSLSKLPYLSLYIQDFLTDEKLAECSAKANGVYIRLMCIMTKSENYGTILLKQKYKQGENFALNFATQIAKHLPYSFEDIIDGLTELLAEKVLNINGDFLEQKRMIKDEKLSVLRSNAGKKGGKKTQEKNKDFASNFAKAKIQANADIDIEYDNEDESKNKEVQKNKLSELDIGKTIQYLDITQQVKYSSEKIVEFWQAFLIHSEGEIHKSKTDKIQHFRNWLKHQKNESRNNQGGNGANTSSKPSRIDAARKF